VVTLWRIIVTRKVVLSEWAAGVMSLVSLHINYTLQNVIVVYYAQNAGTALSEINELDFLLPLPLLSGYSYSPLPR
jgi:hypothetical protein